MKFNMFFIMKSRTSSCLGYVGSKTRSQAQVIEKPVLYSRAHIFGWMFMKFNMFFIMKSRTSSCLGYVGSKTRSQAQVIEKPVLYSRAHVFRPNLIKFGLYVLFNNTLEEYKIWVTWFKKLGHEVKSWKYPFYALLTH